MKERPILFSAPMVRAIIEGRKTQTRRVVKPQPGPLGIHPSFAKQMAETSPYGRPGDRLWVRETWRPIDGMTLAERDRSEVEYRATGDRPKESTDGHWKPSIFMPRWASRITLQNESVRVERLQEITEEDAKAEGVTQDMQCGCLDNGTSECSLRCRFKALWNSINGPGSWDLNPWVWVVTFKRVEAA